MLLLNVLHIFLIQPMIEFSKCEKICEILNESQRRETFVMTFDEIFSNVTQEREREREREREVFK